MAEKAYKVNLFQHIFQLAKESFVYGVASALSGLAIISLVPLYTRTFSVAEYGVYSLLQIIGSMLTMFSVLGLDSAASRWFFDTLDLQQRKSTISTWFWGQCLCGCILALLTCALSSKLSGWLSEEKVLKATPVILMALAIPAGAAGVVFNGWLRYQRKAFWAVLVSSLQLSLNIGAAFLLVVVLKLGMTGAFLASLLVAGIISLMGALVMKQYLSPSYFSIKLLKEMLKYALPLIPAALCLWIMMNMDRIMLKHYTDEAEVGLYSIAVTISLGIGLLTTAFCQAWGPFAFSIMHKPEAGQVYAKVLDYYAFLGCFAGTGMALFAPLLLRIFTTEEYYSVAGIVGILSFGTLLNGARYIATLGSSIAKKSIPGAISIAIGAIANFGFNLLMIPQWGGWGAAYGTVLAWLFSVVYLFRASQKHYRIPYRWKATIYSLSAAVILILANRLMFGDGCRWQENLIRAMMLLVFFPLGRFLDLIPAVHLSAWKKIS